MRQYPKKFLFLSILYLVSLSPALRAQSEPGCDAQRPIIQLEGEKPLLYHASFKVLKYQFTGLFVFKHLEKKQETRVVLLAEAGLSIAEFSVKGDTITCLKALPMVDKKAAKKYLERIIRFALYEQESARCKTKSDNNTVTAICKGNKGKHYYICENKELHSIKYKKGLCRSAVGDIDSSGNTQHLTILKRRKVKVELKLVENAIN